MTCGAAVQHRTRANPARGSSASGSTAANQHLLASDSSPFQQGINQQGINHCSQCERGFCSKPMGPMFLQVAAVLCSYLHHLLVELAQHMLPHGLLHEDTQIRVCEPATPHALLFCHTAGKKEKGNGGCGTDLHQQRSFRPGRLGEDPARGL